MDERWYWAAPLLLDLMENKNGLLQWFKRKDAHLHWSGKGKEKTSGNTDEDSRWVEHVKTAYGFIEGSTEEGECLGRRPHDLVRVLAQMALGAPGIIALRSLLRHGDIAAGKEEMELRDASGKIAWAFRSLFNMPESIALIRGRNRQEPYWKRVLEYGVDGCLQAVMDEYVHVLVESQGLMGRKLADVAGELAAVIVSALSLRTATMNVDDLSCDLSGKNFSPKRFRMRGHYALRFGDYKSDDEEKGHRPEQVRVAFNSPFRPFVLISTSVGQEGLDFHTYCHAVVHWNLPSNPVDLEQREGRVHRYKGHAIRKNVAKCYGASVLSSKERNASDPWKEVFERAKENRPPDSSDLVPYWTFTPEGGAKIERYLPFLPLSREDAGKEDLFYSLTLYRLVFGQSRQQDMVAYFKRSGANQELKEGWEKLYIDLSAPEQKDSQSGKK